MTEVLAPAQAAALFGLLGDDANGVHLAKAAAEFRARFPIGTSDAFRAGTALAILLADRLLTQGQRLVALFCMAEVHRTTHDVLQDPFLIHLVFWTSPMVAIEAERHFALLLLRRQQAQIEQMSSAAFLESFRESRPIMKEDLVDFETAVGKRAVIPSSLLPVKDMAISNFVIRPPDA